MWEAVVTFLLFPILVYLAYLADKGFPWNKSRVSATTANGKQIELGSIQPGECKFVLWFLLGPLLSFWRYIRITYNFTNGISITRPALCLWQVRHSMLPARFPKTNKQQNKKTHNFFCLLVEQVWCSSLLFRTQKNNKSLSLNVCSVSNAPSFTFWWSRDFPWCCCWVR